MTIEMKSTMTRGCLFVAVAALAACETTPDPAPAPAPVVEIYADPIPTVEYVEPAPVPSIDIAEYEAQQAAILAAEAEAAAAVLAAEEAERAAAAAARRPAVVLTLEQKLERAANPNARLAILNREDPSDEINALIRQAYVDKLAADRASGDNAGAAEALVWLAEQPSELSGTEADIATLKRVAEAQALDPDNAKAPGLVSRMRGKLQSHADTLHGQAVAFFVQQEFAPAVKLWETVLLIDPGNTAARDWYAQASAAIDR